MIAPAQIIERVIIGPCEHKWEIADTFKSILDDLGVAAADKKVFCLRHSTPFGGLVLHMPQTYTITVSRNRASFGKAHALRLFALTHIGSLNLPQSCSGPVVCRQTTNLGSLLSNSDLYEMKNGHAAQQVIGD